MGTNTVIPAFLGMTGERDLWEEVCRQALLDARLGLEGEG